jgi:hypothetical protein
MKIIVVDDETVIKTRYFPNIQIEYFDGKSDSIYDILQRLRSISLILINVNYTFSGSHQTDFEGITFLKYLRLHGFKQHCLLYSFLSIEQILRYKPNDNIILSDGTSFRRLPNRFKADELTNLIPKKNQFDLTKFFAAESRFPNDRHFIANWWGLSQLWKAHTHISKASIPEKIIIDRGIEELNPGIISYEGLVARYLYNQRNGVNEQAEQSPRIPIGSLSEADQERLLKLSYGTIRGLLASEKPKILYIDDQAGNGWSLVLQQIIYGEQNPHFTVIVPKKESTISDLYQSVVEESIDPHWTPDLILLDLRLFDEKVSGSKVGDLSGAKLLGKIKCKNYLNNPINCPVLIVTASNKSWSFRELSKLGADGLWIKEGLDDNLDLHQSQENYNKLLDLIVSYLYSPEYQFLKEYKSQLRILGQTADHWWAKGDRFPGYQLNNIPAKQIIGILEDGLTLIENYLKHRIQDSVSPKMLGSYPSLIIVRLFHIIELLHRDDSSDKLSHRFKSHHGINSHYNPQMLNLRNEAAHKVGRSFYHLAEFCNRLFDYLLYPDNCRIVPKSGQRYHGHVTKIAENYIVISPVPMFMRDKENSNVLYFIKNCSEVKVGHYLSFELNVKQHNNSQVYNAINISQFKKWGSLV